MDYKKIIDRALELGFSDIEIRVKKRKGKSIELFLGELSKNQEEENISVILKGIFNNHLGVLGTEEFDTNSLLRSLETLKEMTIHLTDDKEVMLFHGNCEYPIMPFVKYDLDSYDTLQKLELLKKIEKSVLSYDSCISKEVQVEYGENEESLWIVNSQGLDVFQESQYGYVCVSAVAKEKDLSQSSFEIKFAQEFAEFDYNEIARSVASDAIRKLHAYPLETGEYNCIFSPKAFSSLLGAFKGLFSGESALKDLTMYKDKVNTKIMDEKINIIEEGINKEAFSFYKFDYEGVPTRKKYIVKNGVLTTLLHSLKTAKALNSNITGNGAEYGIMIGSLYVENGSNSLDSLLKQAKDGYYITDIQGLHAGLNPVSGDFSLQSSGFYINDGKLSRAVNLSVVSGNFMEMLGNIESIANDLEYHFKIGSPSIFVGKLSVSGTN